VSRVTATATRDNPNQAAPEGALRSEIYALLSLAFSFPDESLYDRVKDGQLAEQLTAALPRLPYRLRSSDLAWRALASHDEMQSEYIRLFQIGGRRGPPCPIHAGHYSRDRGRRLQHLIRFYNFFGFRMSEGVMPDHISVQLEFMGELAAGDLADSESLLRAQGDFLRGQLGWCEELAERVRRLNPAPFYRALAALTARLVAADQRFIRNELGGDHYGRT